MKKMIYLSGQDLNNLFNLIFERIVNNPAILDVLIESEVQDAHPNYDQTLIRKSIKTVRNQHTAYTQYLLAMVVMDYGCDEMQEREASIMAYVNDRYPHIQESSIKDGFYRARKELHRRAFETMENMAFDFVNLGEFNAHAPQVARDVVYREFGDSITLSKKLFGMLVVAVAKRQEEIMKTHGIGEYANEELLEKARQERELKSVNAAAVSAKKAAEKSRKHAEIMSRPRIKFTIAGKELFAFDITREEASAMLDGTPAYINEEIVNVSKSLSGRINITPIIGAKLIADSDQQRKSANITSIVQTPKLDTSKAQTAWMTTNEGEVTKAMIVPAELVRDLPIIDGYFTTTINGGPLYLNKSGLHQVGTCIKATKAEKSAAKGENKKTLDMAA